MPASPHLMHRLRLVRQKLIDSDMSSGSIVIYWRCYLTSDDENRLAVEKEIGLEEREVKTSYVQYLNKYRHQLTLDGAKDSGNNMYNISLWDEHPDISYWDLETVFTSVLKYYTDMTNAKDAERARRYFEWIGYSGSFSGEQIADAILPYLIDMTERPTPSPPRPSVPLPTHEGDLAMLDGTATACVSLPSDVTL